MLSENVADSAIIALPEAEEVTLGLKCGLLTKSWRRVPCTSSSAITTLSNLSTNCSPEITNTRTLRAVSWNTCNNDSSITTSSINMHYPIGHDTYFKQMLATTKTSLHRGKRLDVTYVRAAPRWTPLPLSALLDKRLVPPQPDKPQSHCLWPTPLQNPIKKQAKKMKACVVVPTNIDCWAETAYKLPDVGKGSDSWQPFQRQFVNSSRKWGPPDANLFSNSSSQSCWELSARVFQTGTPHRQLGDQRKTFQRILIPLPHNRQWISLLNILEEAVDEASQFPKRVVPVVTRSLGVKRIVANWNRNIYHRHGKATVTHICRDGWNSIKSEKWNQCGTILVRS